MCLHAKSFTVTEEDIKVYKFLNVNDYGRMTSPFYMEYWSMGERKRIVAGSYTHEQFSRQVKDAKQWLNIGSYIRIEEGFHSLGTLEDAYKCAKIHSGSNNRLKVFECVIPAGSKVFTGTWNMYYAGYASDAITLVKKVSVFKIALLKIKQMVNKIKSKAFT